MTDDIDPARPDPDRWRLLLDEGEGLEVWPRPDDPDAAGPDMLLWLPVRRAHDLSRVLDAYSKLMEIFHDVSQVSSTEESLARGLRDAAAVATGQRLIVAPPTKVWEGHRLKAMDVLQASRPELSHSALSAVVDAAAGWIEQQQDNRAIDLLNTVVPDAGTAAYFALLGRPAPQQLILPTAR